MDCSEKAKEHRQKKRLVNDWVRSLTSLDLRHLGLIRILVGLTCIFDVLRRIPYIDLFYSNSGVLSNHYALFSEKQRVFSLLFAFSQPLEVWLFFSITIIFSIFFTIGWWSRLSGFLTWICITSIVNRNPLTIYGGDTVLVNTLLIIQLLPLGACWSIDALNAGGQRGTIKSLAATLLFLQLAAIYFLAGIQKEGTTWMQGLGLYYPLFWERMVSPIGAYAREYLPIAILKTMCFIGLFIEITTPLLLLSPYRTTQLRRIAFCLLFIFQGTLWLFFNIALFQIIMLALSTILLSAKELDFIERKFGTVCGAMSHKKSFNSVFEIFTREFLAVVLTVIFFCDLFSGNVFFLRFFNFEKPQFVRSFVDYTSFRQSWAMFSPEVRQHGQYLLFEGIFDDRHHTDLLTGDALDLTTAFPTPKYWDQQLESMMRLFAIGSVDTVEMQRWLRVRRGGLTVADKHRLLRVAIWEIRYRYPEPDERGTKAVLDLQREKKLEVFF